MLWNPPRTVLSRSQWPEARCRETDRCDAGCLEDMPDIADSPSKSTQRPAYPGRLARPDEPDSRRLFGDDITQ